MQIRCESYARTLLAHVAAVASVHLDLDESTSHRMAETAIEGMRVIATAARAAKGKAS